MLAEIVSAEPDLADVFYLVALILAGVSFGLRLATRPFDAVDALAVAAIGFVAAGLLVL